MRNIRAKNEVAGKGRKNGRKLELGHTSAYWAFATLLTAVIFLSGCGKDEGPRADGAAIATVGPSPSAASCFQPNIPPQTWSNYQPYGFRNYRWGHTGYQYPQQNWGSGYLPPSVSQSFTNQGFCGCPVGHQPVCDPTVGMTCIPTQYTQNHRLAGWQWNQGNYGFQQYTHQYAGYNRQGWGSMGGPYGHQGMGGPYYGHQQGLSCSPYVGQTCMVGSLGCGYGRCQPVAPGSQIGICIQ